MSKIAALVGTVALLMALTAVPAQAAQTATRQAVQQQINAALTATPGGEQTSANTVEWNDGDIILTVASNLSTQAVGSCATGYVCAYSSTNLLGTKLSFGSCATYSTSTITVRSVANARSSGTVRGKNNAGTTLVTVTAGNHDNSTPTGITQVTCS